MNKNIKIVIDSTNKFKLETSNIIKSKSFVIYVSSPYDSTFNETINFKMNYFTLK